MGYYDPDLYGQPEAFGLELVGSIDLDNESYQFNILAVLHEPTTDKFYIIQDSGCSCPSPFEDHTSRDALGEPLTAHEAVKRIQSSVDGAKAYEYGTGPDDPSDLIAAILRK
jgi:hypothetical protein